MAFFDNFSKKVQDVAFVATEKAQHPKWNCHGLNP